MNKEYTYDIGKYTIGVDENSENGIGLTVAMIENNEIKFLGNCYGDNARCIDLLIRENQELKRQLEVGEEQYNDLVEEKEKLEQENQELKELNIAISKGLKKVTAKRNKWRNRYYKVRRENVDQQKEFIEWLKQNIENEEYCYLSQNPSERCRKDVFEEVLSKHKEIVGDDKQ